MPHQRSDAVRRQINNALCSTSEPRNAGGTLQLRNRERFHSRISLRNRRVRMSSLNRILVVGSLLALSACASPPQRVNDICAVFDQRDGWFNNWQWAAERTERKYGVPVHTPGSTISNAG